MKILQSSDYRIYIDDVRVDPYVKNWTAQCGLRASDATATVTLYRTKKLEQWKGYLAQVRIFARNIFSGKFTIVFEGEIVNRNWGDQRSDVGEIIFMCKGFYHWLDIPIPLLIGDDDTYNFVKRFQYEAQNMDVEGITKFWLSREDQLMKDLTLKQIISQLFELINSGYYNYDNSTFAWTNLEARIKVMGDIITEFRSAGYLDAFTWTRSTQIESFYVYLNEILTQMMFEFYQDKDGAMRIKNPSWKDDILKAHVLDESVVQNVSGYNDWENEPTRVLVVGGQSDVSKYTGKQIGADGTLTVPMGLYIGKPGEGQYFSQNVEVLLAQTGDDSDYSDPSSDGTVQLTWKADKKKANAIGAGSGYGGMMLYVEAAYNDVKDRFGKTNFMGGYNNRNVVGGSTKSMHAYGRAFDIGSTPEIMSKIAEYAKGFPNIQYVIYNRRICGGSKGMDWRPYDGTNPHTDHVHCDFLPVDGASTSKTSSGSEDSGSQGTGSLANYMNEDLLTPSNIPSAETINKIIKHGVDLRGGKSKLLNQGAAFVQAAKDSGLNPLFMLALGGWESGWGTNTISRTKNNFFSIGAIDSNPTGGAYSYATPADAIVSAAKWIRKNWYDRGQTTIWKMNHSKSGKHNWASDSNWVKGVAGVWKGFGNVSNDGTSISPSSSPTTTTTSSPNAAVGGVSITTRYAPTTPVALPPSQIKPVQQIPVDYHSFNVDIVKYPIPTVANTYKYTIYNRLNGVNGNLICYIIETASAWREKYSSNEHYGLMGIPKKYIDLVLEGKTTKMYNPEDNIFHGTKQFQNGYNRYTKKVTFGLASLYLGDISALEKPIKDAGAEDFSKVRNYLDKDVVNFVDTVLDKFCKFFGGHYIKGDPHRPVSVGKPGGDIPADNDETKDYESSYKPIMSDEERLYKVNLKISEQLLIRYDSEAVPDDAMGADELVQRYAKYMMQLYRAESHGVNVSLSTCMPFIRPGWNAWLEPTRRNVVFYVTGVNHQGSYGNGAFSTVVGGFVRDPSSYDSIEDNIFVGKTKVKASDFGEVVKKSEMNNLKSQLSALHNQTDEIIGDARKISTLSKIYSSAVGKETEFTTMWNNEFTSSEINTKIKTMYKSAPSVVKTRSSNFQSIITDAADFYKKVLLNTTF